MKVSMNTRDWSRPDTLISTLNPSASSSSASASSSGTMGRIRPVESATADCMTADGGSASVGGGSECVDFNFLEEFQVQLALAISALDPDARDDPESTQINAAKRISLGCSAPRSDSASLVDILSLHYLVNFLIFVFSYWVLKKFRLYILGKWVCELGYGCFIRQWIL